MSQGTMDSADRGHLQPLYVPSGGAVSHPDWPREQKAPSCSQSSIDVSWNALWNRWPESSHQPRGIFRLFYSRIIIIILIIIKTHNKQTKKKIIQNIKEWMKEKTTNFTECPEKLRSSSDIFKKYHYRFDFTIFSSSSLRLRSFLTKSFGFNHRKS